MPVGHLSSLEKCLFSSHACFLIGLFVFLILLCMSCLYVLDINSSSVASCANIFSHLVDCLSFCWWLPLLLSLISSHVFIFALLSFALEDWSKKISLRFMPENVLPLSSLVFISHVASFHFRSPVWIFLYLFESNFLNIQNIVLITVFMSSADSNSYVSSGLVVISQSPHCGSCFHDF